MKGVIATLTVVCLSISAANAAELQWEGDYGTALDATKAAQAPLLIVIDKPAEETASVKAAGYAGPDAGAELLAPYKLCHIDAATPYGQEVAKRFRVDSYPYTVIIDKTGSTILFRRAGEMDKDAWNVTLTSYKTGVAQTNYVAKRSSGGCPWCN